MVEDGKGVRRRSSTTIQTNITDGTFQWNQTSMVREYIEKYKTFTYDEKGKR